MWYIDVYSGKVWVIFIFYVETSFFGKKTKVIVHGFVKKWGFQVGNGIEPFNVRMYVYMFWNYISQMRVTASLVFFKTIDLLVMFRVKIYNMHVVGVASTNSGKLSKLWLAFSLLIYRCIFWQSIGDFMSHSLGKHHSYWGGEVN